MGAGAHGDDGVDENGEVGAAASLLVVFKIEFGSGHGGEVSPCGEADDSDSVRFELPIRGFGAGEAEGLLDVGERAVGIALRESIVQDDTGDAVGVEPLGDGSAFASHNPAVASARADHDGGAVGFLRVEDGKGGIGIFECPGAERGFSFRPEFDGFRGCRFGRQRPGDSDDGCEKCAEVLVHGNGLEGAGLSRLDF